MLTPARSPAPAGVLVVPAAFAPVQWWRDVAPVELRLGRELRPGPCRLFAAALAAGVLPLYAQEFPDDPSPRAAIDAARGYALGRTTVAARHAACLAAWTAAQAATRAGTRTAARAAARAASWAAAGTVSTGAAAGIVARAATRAATGAAARADAPAAAWAAQSRLLRLYLPTQGGRQWLTRGVRSLAAAVVADPLAPDSSLLPVLADALEDAGAAGWLAEAFRDPAAGPLCCPGWWLLRTCCPLPTTDPDGVPIT